MTITLITGANKGLGHETARRLVADGHTVYVGARDEARGRKAAELLGPQAKFVQLDVTDEDSVKAAAEYVRAESGRLDVLVNNAGIVNEAVRNRVGDVTAADMQRVYDVNVFGVVRVTHAFLPLLAASERAVVVNVGSGLGSRAAVNDPSRPEFQVGLLDYSSAKTALVMLTVQYAKAYPGMRFNVVDPGYTATDINDNRGTQPVEVGAEVIVRMASIGVDGPTGEYFDNSGVAVW